ncbi:hypothetical protein [Streptomyces sp. NPDC001978]|uniref:hypothetical protein n=1 Tax=Streptomyces sp. NPDC001978 TaxID=3364627 RepID=UPI00367718C8
MARNMDRSSHISDDLAVDVKHATFVACCHLANLLVWPQNSAFDPITVKDPRIEHFEAMETEMAEQIQ